MNAITIYLLVRTLLPIGFELEYFFGALCRFLPKATVDFLAQGGLIALGWLLLLFLYRRKIFLKM